MELGKLITEQRNPSTLTIDEMTTLDLVTTINAEDARVAAAIEPVLYEIAALVDATAAALAGGGRLIYVGAGTSGRLGVLDASECPPTFGVDPRLVVGIAASGRTPYTLGAMRYGRSIGAKIGCIVNNPGSEMAQVAHFPIVVLCGPEVITGSTRMKAGTAQKLLLNMISTAAMIRLGKVYENLMIDVEITNQKLRTRALGIIREITGVDEAEATQALDAYGSVKAAVFALLTDADAETARTLLTGNDGHLKRALQAFATMRG